MRPYERREAGAYPYFKLATWDARIGTWRAGRNILETEAEALATARKPGRYRVERFDERDSQALEPFEVAGR